LSVGADEEKNLLEKKNPKGLQSYKKGLFTQTGHNVNSKKVKKSAGGDNEKSQDGTRSPGGGGFFARKTAPELGVGKKQLQRLKSTEKKKTEKGTVSTVLKKQTA